MVAAVDLSLTCTGLAKLSLGVSPVLHTRSVTTESSQPLYQRVRQIRDVAAEWTPPGCVLAFEAPSFGSFGGKAWDRSELAGVVKERLELDAVQVFMVSPKTIKKYATGSGDADKKAMLAAARQLLPGFAGRNDNEADAAWLAALIADLLGAPFIAVPAVNRKGFPRIKPVMWS